MTHSIQLIHSKIYNAFLNLDTLGFRFGCRCNQPAIKDMEERNNRKRAPRKREMSLLIESPNNGLAISIKLFYGKINKLKKIIIIKVLEEKIVDSLKLGRRGGWGDNGQMIREPSNYHKKHRTRNSLKLKGKYKINP